MKDPAPPLPKDVAAFLSAIPLEPGEVVVALEVDENARPASMADDWVPGQHLTARFVDVELGIRHMRARTMVVVDDGRAVETREWSYYVDGDGKPVASMTGGTRQSANGPVIGRL